MSVGAVFIRALQSSTASVSCGVRRNPKKRQVATHNRVSALDPEADHLASSELVETIAD
jgi:hypothetical protein